MDCIPGFLCKIQILREVIRHNMTNHFSNSLDLSNKLTSLVVAVVGTLVRSKCW